MISIYMTFKDEKEARMILKHLLEKRLIACANMLPIKSIYWWQGKIMDENETAVIAKAPKKNFHAIKEAVRKLHSYDIPCIVSFQIEHTDEDFFKWVGDEAKGSP